MVSTSSITIQSDRTTCAGCRCKKYRVFTGRIAANRQTAGIKFTHRPKISIFATHGRLVAQILARSRSTWVCLAVLNFTPVGARRVGTQPSKRQQSPIFDKESPRRCEPFDRFIQLLGLFYAQLRCISVLHLKWFHFTGYRVSAEKPHVHRLPRNFPCTL